MQENNEKAAAAAAGENNSKFTPNDIYVHDAEAGIMQRVIKSSSSFMIVAITDDNPKQATVSFLAKDREQTFKLLNAASSFINSAREKNRIETKSIKFENKEAFDKAVEQMKQMGLPVTGRNCVTHGTYRAKLPKPLPKTKL